MVACNSEIYDKDLWINNVSVSENCVKRIHSDEIIHKHHKKHKWDIRNANVYLNIKYGQIINL